MRLKLADGFVAAAGRGGRGRAAVGLFRLVAGLLLLLGGGQAAEPAPWRMVVLPLAGDDASAVAESLRRMMKEERQVEIELSDPALVAIVRPDEGGEGGLNLTRDEARGLGQRLGVDYYVLGRVVETPRQAGNGKVVFTALAGLYLVESRRGELLRFEFLATEGETAGEARTQLLARLPAVWRTFREAMTTAWAAGGELPPGGAEGETPPVEVFTDEPFGRNLGVTSPVFERQVRPVYPEMAARAEVVATVEVSALFGTDGLVSDLRLERWAGFGLDEAALAAVRQLRFRPALREGRPVPFRGLVRYNFRRPTPQAIRGSARSREEIDRLRQSLRELLKTRPVP